MDGQALLLMTAFRHTIKEPSIQEAFEAFMALTETALDYQDFTDAVDACLGQGLIREPIRLPQGALQCHWHLELTPKGVAATRALLRMDEDKRHMGNLPTLR